MSTMVYRVISTKLTEEEHNRLLDICNRDGCTPSSYIKQAVLGFVEAEENAIANGTHDSCKSGTTVAGNERHEEKIIEKPQEKKSMTLEEMLRAMKRQNSLRYSQ